MKCKLVIGFVLLFQWGNWAFAAEPPNVLFVAIDDLNDWVGCLQGHPQVMTPNIDRLAARGMLFTNAHCTSPACNPSRAAIFSGMMPWQTGVWSNQSPKLPGHRPELLLLPTAFQRAGYITCGTGKLLHGGKKRNRGLFDKNFYPEQRWSPFERPRVSYTTGEVESKGTDNPRHVISVSKERFGTDQIVLPLNGMPSDRNPDTRMGESFDWGPFDVPDTAMGDGKITQWAIEQIEGGFEKPFFVAVGYYRPHIPLWAPRRYFELYPEKQVKLPPHNEDDLDDLSQVARRWAIEPVTAGAHATVVRHRQWHAAVAAYLACISFVDQQVGQLLDALDNSPYAENTIILLWSDHGWHLGEKQHWGKWTGWERSTRVPLVIVPPKTIKDRFAPAGSRCNQPVTLIDLYPTLAELCQLDAPKNLDGRSLVPLLASQSTTSKSREDAATRRTAVTTFGEGNVSIRTRHLRYIRYANASEEFYDHRTDPNEWHNLIDQPKYADSIGELRAVAERSGYRGTREKAE